MLPYMLEITLFSKTPKAPPLVKQFCKTKLTTRGLDPNKINISIFDGKYSKLLVAAASINHIIIGSAIADKLQKALENPSDKSSSDIIKTYSTILDHEVAHLKINDSITRYFAFIGINLTNYILSLLIMNSAPLKTFFQKPAHKPKSFLFYFTYLLAFIACSTIRFKRYQEDRADEYAIFSSKRPRSTTSSCKAARSEGRTNDKFSLRGSTSQQKLTSYKTTLSSIYDIF
jgi:Peptidase family M48